MECKKKPTHRKHNPYHDYKSRCIYHITLVVSDRCKALGRIVDCRDRGVDLKKVTQPNGDVSYVTPNGNVSYMTPDGEVWTEMQVADTAEVQFTPLGLEVQRAIQGIPAFELTMGNDVQILGACVMPEHIHFVLFVRKPSKKALGLIIRGFKQGCNKLLKKYLGADLEKVAQPDGEADGDMKCLGADLEKVAQPDGEADGDMKCLGADLEKVAQPDGEADGGKKCLGADLEKVAQPDGEVEREDSQSGIAAFLKCASPRILRNHALFEDGFDETRLRRRGQLAKMIAYVHNNPKHRWLRDNKPEWLLPMRGIEIAGRMYDALGNINLLALPRFQNHTRYKWYQANDTEAIRGHKNDCVIHARKNFAIVSPFVHPDEVAVRDFCLQEGHSIIQLCDNGFSDLQQCPGGLYEYCVNGQVLLLVPSGWPHVDRKGRCTREECRVLNGYAGEICGERA